MFGESLAEGNVSLVTNEAILLKCCFNNEDLTNKSIRTNSFKLIVCQHSKTEHIKITAAQTS